MTAPRRRSQRGFSIVELLVGTGLLVGGGGALLVGMYHGMIFVDYLSDLQVAMHAAQGKLEELAATDFDTLAADAAANSTAGERFCMAANVNCDAAHTLNPETSLTSGKLNVHIRPYPDPNDPTPDMLDIHVAASWRSRGRCIGGEDAGSGAGQCSGLLENGEDLDHDGWMDSPVMLSTRVSRKDDPS